MDNEKFALKPRDKALKPELAFLRKRGQIMKVISGPASKELAERISALTGFYNIPVASKVFPDGESYVRLEGDVKGENVVIVQTTCPPMQDGRLFN